MSEIEGARQSKYYGNLGSACMQQGQQHSMSTGASHDGRNAGGSDGDVQYFDSDFSFEEHAAECVAAQERTSDGCDESSAGAIAASPQHADCDRGEDLLLPRSQSKVWDAFHSHHSAGNFYKPRRYLIKSFPCILQYLSANDDGGDNELQTNDSGDDNDGNDDRILLEIGCGSGSSCIPIIKRCSEVKCSGNGKRILLACDASPVAVETTSRLIEKMMEKDSELSFGVFAADPGLCEDETDVPFLREVNSAYKKLALRGSSDVDVQVAVDRGLVGIVLMVFVLSAVTPSRVGRFLEQVYEATKPSGRVCFRDYGLYDLPMLRFPAAARRSSPSEDPVFIRGEGTIARFFSVETARDLFESAGFSTVELRYCTVFNHNRKTGQKLKRVFVHGVFEKLI